MDNMARLMVTLEGMAIDKLRLVLRFAEFLAKLAKEREVNNNE